MTSLRPRALLLMSIGYGLFYFILNFLEKEGYIAILDQQIIKLIPQYPPDFKFSFDDSYVIVFLGIISIATIFWLIMNYRLHKNPKLFFDNMDYNFIKIREISKKLFLPLIIIHLILFSFIVYGYLNQQNWSNKSFYIFKSIQSISVSLSIPFMVFIPLFITEKFSLNYSIFFLKNIFPYMIRIIGQNPLKIFKTDYYFIIDF